MKLLDVIKYRIQALMNKKRTIQRLQEAVRLKKAEYETEYRKIESIVISPKYYKLIFRSIYGKTPKQVKSVKSELHYIIFGGSVNILIDRRIRGVTENDISFKLAPRYKENKR